MPATFFRAPKAELCSRTYRALLIFGATIERRKAAHGPEPDLQHVVVSTAPHKEKPIPHVMMPGVTQYHRTCRHKQRNIHTVRRRMKAIERGIREK